MPIILDYSETPEMEKVEQDVFDILSDGAEQEEMVIIGFKLAGRRVVNTSFTLMYNIGRDLYIGDMIVNNVRNGTSYYETPSQVYGEASLWIADQVHPLL